MKKNIRKAGITLLIISCMGFVRGCGNEPQAQMQTESENVLSKTEWEHRKSEDDESENDDLEYRKSEVEEPENNSNDNGTAENGVGNDFSEKISEDVNKEFFYEKAGRQGIDGASAETYFQTLLDDNVFQDGTMELTGLIIEDMDGNGQKDMLVTVAETEEKAWYGSGCLCIYMNDDEPYRFEEEDCSYLGYFDAFAADIDNDENVEIVFSAQGSGVGAVGDSYKTVFKYKNHCIERMELPSDLKEYYDCGLKVIVTQNPEENSYGAYCPYFDEIISFSALNSLEPSDATKIVGGNVRGYFDLQCVKYEGQNALQVSEYLNGEGGIIQCVATAQFLIVWDENGEANVTKWWIMMDDDVWESSHDSRIVYTDYSATELLYGCGQEAEQQSMSSMRHDSDAIWT